MVEKQTEPIDWVNSLVSVQKPNKKTRICINPQDINKATKRELYHLQTVEEDVAEIPNEKFVSILDTNHSGKYN